MNKNDSLSWNFLLEVNFSVALSVIFLGNQQTWGLALVRMKLARCFCEASHRSNSWTRPIFASKALMVAFLCSLSANSVFLSFCSFSFNNLACSSIFLSTCAFLSSWNNKRKLGGCHRQTGGVTCNCNLNGIRGNYIFLFPPQMAEIATNTTLRL